eukprot:Pgem_evm1s14619
MVSRNLAKEIVNQGCFSTKKRITGPEDPNIALCAWKFKLEPNSNKNEFNFEHIDVLNIPAMKLGGNCDDET